MSIRIVAFARPIYGRAKARSSRSTARPSRHLRTTSQGLKLRSSLNPSQPNGNGKPTASWRRWRATREQLAGFAYGYASAAGHWWVDFVKARLGSPWPRHGSATAISSWRCRAARAYRGTASAANCTTTCSPSFRTVGHCWGRCRPTPPPIGSIAGAVGRAGRKPGGPRYRAALPDHGPRC